MKSSGDNQFTLFATRRFAPFFWTQFFGAFNDNVFKNALILLIAYRAATSGRMGSDVLVNIAAGVFILPFFLFSATAGQIADKFEKTHLIRRIKMMEIIIMLNAAAAFYFSSVTALIVLLFLMGTQSAFFGPVKYSIIPQHLKEEELVGGNALVEMGTFLAILLGTMGGGILSQMTTGHIWLGVVVFGIAVSGWAVSRGIPYAEPADPGLALNWNPVSQTMKTIRFARIKRPVFLSILGISWFWLLGAAYLTQLPNFTKNILRSDESVVTLLLTIFSVGIGVGSLLCERLSGRRVELGLVPLGSIGLSLFGLDLCFAYPPTGSTGLLGISGFLASSGSLRVLSDLLFIGIFGGFYIVPLFAMVQIRTEPAYRSRVIAANNIFNALFMVASSLLGVVFLGLLDFSIPHFFLVLAVMNAAVAIYIYSLVPEFTMRFLIWTISHTLYRVRHRDLDRIPETGAAVLVCNHVSYVDALIIAGACRRPIRFVMDASIYKLPVLNFIFRTGKTIPIGGKTKSPEVYREALGEIARALDDGELVCIFPEGHLTYDGEIDRFREGIEKIIEKSPVPVVPMALKGLWGSFFSRRGGKAMGGFPRRFWSRIELAAGEPVGAENVTARALYAAVKSLRGDER
ncbi:MAG: MFS transporter [Desulfobacteraceae bacterium]|nr:MFS transporter [Desulfobacteraceae bacterium]